MGLKLCITPGCLGTSYGSRCQECERAYQAERNASPARAAYRERAYKRLPRTGHCACCGTDQDLTRHHVVPVYHAHQHALQSGDGYVVVPGVGNIVPMCRSCNSSIGARTMEGLICPQHGGKVVEQ